jgi:PKD repeat protein
MNNLCVYNSGISFPLFFLERMKALFSVTLALLCSLSAHSQGQITGYEYWFDDNYIERVSSTLSPTASVELDLEVGVQDLSLGLHVYNVRFADDSGRFSSVLSQVFLCGGSQNLIDAMEYWFDDEYEQATLVEFSPQLHHSFNSMVNVSALSDGLHRMHIRFRESGGFWSAANSDFIQKYGSSSSMLNQIKGYRYWLDDTAESAVSIELGVAVSPFELIETINMQPIPHGIHVTHYQFQDLSGLWSVVLSDTIMKDPFPIAQFTASSTHVCMGDSIQFFDLSLDADSVYWSFGDGEFVTQLNPFHVFDMPGAYDVALTAIDSASGLDSTLVLPAFVTVWGNVSSGFESEINGGEVQFTNSSIQASNYFWSFGDDATSEESAPEHTYSADGTYTVMLVAFNLCGSDTSYANVTITDVGISQSSGKGEISIFPNPFHDALQISFTHENTSMLSLRLYDASGREVATLLNKQHVPVAFNFEWKDETLPAGMYMLKMQGDDFVASYPLVKM